MGETPLSLLGRLQTGGDAADCERFVRQYTPLLEQQAARKGVPAADAADVAQAVLLRLLAGRLTRYERRDGSRFRNWLRTGADRVIADHLRWQDARPLPGPDGLFGAPAAPAAAGDGERQFLLVLLEDAEGQVRGDFGDAARAADRGVRREGRPAAEVAAELSMTATAVYLACGRVVARLRESLADKPD